MTRERVAVIGGGPAGAFAASLLAEAGRDVTLFDERMAWEKPCGGGLTAKALDQYPFLRENAYPKKTVRDVAMSIRGGPRVKFVLRDPICIYSREVLNQLLLDRAQMVGARLVRERITSIDRNGQWNLQGTADKHAADFLVLAAGARNPFSEF